MASEPAPRSLSASDVLAAVKTLDEACGEDAGYFRYRLRQWVRVQEVLATRPRRLKSEG